MPNIHSSITFALVNIPVIVNPIIKNNDTSFNQLHKKCMHRIKYIKYCPYCHKDVVESDIVKGYEIEKDNYLTFDKKEIDKLKIENNKEIEIISFVKASDIEPYYFEKSYVLNATNKSKAYNLFCEALKVTKKVAIAKTIIGSKFYYCVLRFTENQIIMTSLFFEEEIKISEGKTPDKVNDKELDLAIKLIDNLSGKFTPEKYKDEYQSNIKKAIEDKLNGKTIKGKKVKQKKQINDLMKALESSLKRK